MYSNRLTRACQTTVLSIRGESARTSPVLACFLMHIVLTTACRNRMPYWTLNGVDDGFDSW